MTAVMSVQPPLFLHTQKCNLQSWVWHECRWQPIRNTHYIWLHTVSSELKFWSVSVIFLAAFSASFGILVSLLRRNDGFFWFVCALTGRWQDVSYAGIKWWESSMSPRIASVQLSVSSFWCSERKSCAIQSRTEAIRKGIEDIYIMMCVKQGVENIWTAFVAIKFFMSWILQIYNCKSHLVNKQNKSLGRVSFGSW